jgi:hypothetical protein
LNASESLLAELLELDGWSCHPGYRVSISKPDKVKIGRPSHPSTIEVDVLALKHGRVMWVESKTYMDSNGVQAKTLQEGYAGPGRVRVFNDRVFREVARKALLRQLRDNGAIEKNFKTVDFGFAAWKFQNEAAREAVAQRFEKQGWHLFDRAWLVQHLELLADTSYRDSTAALVVKLLRRES